MKKNCTSELLNTHLQPGTSEYVGDLFTRFEVASKHDDRAYILCSFCISMCVEFATPGGSHELKDDVNVEVAVAVIERDAMPVFKPLFRTELGKGFGDGSHSVSLEGV